MSADTFVSALFIITAVVAAGILINAVYPIVWSSASTFSSSAHETDTRMRTDFKIVNSWAKDGNDVAYIWMKNVGSNSLGATQIEDADVFIVTPNTIINPTYNGAGTSWIYSLTDTANTNWETGETLKISIDLDGTNFNKDNTYTFQFVLPNGVTRSIEFTPSS